MTTKTDSQSEEKTRAEKLAGFKDFRESLECFEFV